MSLKLLKHEVYKNAAELDACGDELQQIKLAGSLDELFNLYHENIRFCMYHDFPSARFLKLTLRHEARRKGIYIDEQLAVSRPRAVFLGRCLADVNTAGVPVTRLFVRHKSEVTISAGLGTYVVVDVFDSATVRVNACKDARVTIFRVGGGRVEGENVRIIDKQLNQYWKR